MKCEYCRKIISPEDIAHGIRYGVMDNYSGAFVPAKDSAFTVICAQCGSQLYRLIYAKLNTTTINPTLYKTLMQTR
jgi:hypothetical protein